MYYTGDSSDAHLNKQYQATFSNILAYAFNRNHEKGDYFPVFLVGNTFQTFINNRVPQDKSTLSLLSHSMINNNVKLRTTIDPSKSFILDELTNQTLEEYVLDGAYFNRQSMGLRVKDFEKENILNRRYQIVATFNDAP